MTRRHTCAKNMPAHVLRCNEVLRVSVRDVALERGVADHLRQLRTRFRVAEKRLREEDDKRLPEVTVDLATEDVILQEVYESKTNSSTYET